MAAMVIWDGQNPTGGYARWALIGVEPGKAMTTKDEGKAKRWASSHKVDIFDCGSAAEYDSYIQWVQRPLAVTGGAAGGGPVADLGPVVAAIEKLGVTLGAKLDALPAEIDRLEAAVRAPRGPVT